MKIVDFPSYKMVIFHSYVSLPENIYIYTYTHCTLFYRRLFVDDPMPMFQSWFTSTPSPKRDGHADIDPVYPHEYSKPSQHNKTQATE